MILFPVNAILGLSPSAADACESYGHGTRRGKIRFASRNNFEILTEALALIDLRHASSSPRFHPTFPFLSFSVRKSGLRAQENLIDNLAHATERGKTFALCTALKIAPIFIRPPQPDGNTEWKKHKLM